MSRRLIDAIKLIQGRPENLNPKMNDKIKSAYNDGWNTCNSFWVNLIELQSTAYDTDKVVEQLKDSSKTYCEEYKQRENNLYLFDAIEIVEKGGAE